MIAEIFDSEDEGGAQCSSSVLESRGGSAAAPPSVSGDAAVIGGIAATRSNTGPRREIQRQMEELREELQVRMQIVHMQRTMCTAMVRVLTTLSRKHHLCVHLFTLESSSSIVSIYSP